MKKILVFDLDGTIVVNSQISPKLVSLIRILSRSMKIIFASGRMLSSMNILLQKYGLYGIEIAYNGAMISNEENLYNFCLDRKDANSIIDFLRAQKVHRQIYVDDVLYVEEENEFSRLYSNQSGIGYNLVDDLKKIVENGCTYKILSFDLPETIEELKNKSISDLKDNADIFKSSNVYLEFVKKGINKQFAVEFLSKKMGFSFEDVVAFGDGENDVELLEKSGISFAMIPGNEKNARIAAYTVENEDGEGVFRSLEFLKSIGEI